MGLYLLYFLIDFPVTSRVPGTHIVFASPHFYIIGVMILYLLGSCVSSLLSSDKIIQCFGAAAFVTFLAAYLIHTATLVSVWCCFAAVLSFIVYFYFRRNRTSGFRDLTPRFLNTHP